MTVSGAAMAVACTSCGDLLFPAFGVDGAKRRGVFFGLGQGGMCRLQLKSSATAIAG